MLAIKFYPLDCEEILLYTIQDYYGPRGSYLNYFEEPNIPPLKEELHAKENIVLEENIEISEEINEVILIKELQVLMVIF